MSDLLPIGDARLEFRYAGPAPDVAPTLVLLHEGLGCAGLWRDFPDRLAVATGCGTVAYSRQGYGRSSPCALPRPLSYMQDEARDVLPAVLDAIGLRRGLLIGHSDGASIAAVHGGMHRDSRIAGLVLMAPHFFTEPSGLAAIAEARIAFETGDLRARLARHHGGNVDCAFRGWNDAWLDPEFREWDLRDHVQRIEVPVLAIQGTDDRYGTAAQIDTVAALAAGPVETLMLDGCGHAPFKERPEQTLNAVADFVVRCLAQDEADR